MRNFTKIKEFRQKLGLSQNEFARHVGVSPSCVCKCENGKQFLTVENLFAICKTFECAGSEIVSLEYCFRFLLSEDDDPLKLHSFLNSLCEMYENKTI